MSGLARVVINTADTPPEKPVDPPKDGDRPVWLPSKFKTPEDFAASYAELEKKLGQPAAPTPPVDNKPADDKKAEDTADPAKVEEGKAQEAAKALTSVDMDAIGERFWKDKKLEQADEDTLIKALTPVFGDRAKQVIADYTQSMVIANDVSVQRTIEPFGNNENKQKMLDWGRDNLPQASRDALNTLWQSDDINQQIEGSKMLVRLYTEKNGQMPKTMITDTSVAAGQSAYTSWDEVTTDMSDPQYKSNEAFRAKVAQKLAISKI